MNYIDYYIDEILKNQLIEFGLKSNIIILDDVRNKIYSLIKHWNEKDFRNAVLITGIEEGEFYEPNANILLKSFIVVTVRNTLIESASSEFYEKLNFEVQIKDDQIKKITQNAINYFKKNFDEIINTNFDFNLYDDYYQSASDEFPIGFHMLKILGNLNKKEIYFDKINVNSQNLIKIVCDNTNIYDRNRYVVEDGVSEGYNSQLVSTLKQAIEMNEIGFFTD